MKVSILGTRGIPARHGGFETFAEHLALYLTKRGHDAVVYCQAHETAEFSEDNWNGITRIHIPAPDNAFGTMRFDWESIKHSSRAEGVVLSLGYNTAAFTFLFRLRRIPHLMNMDGLEWQRLKWTKFQRAWLWLNEILGARLANHLIADHPDIKKHLTRHTRQKKITVIPYGADRVFSGDQSDPLAFDLAPGSYILLVARSEPENSILEIVTAFSAKPRDTKLVVLGRYLPKFIDYHREVFDAASADVLFPGSLYDREALSVLRYHARAYVHGHTVGGTNPSLVEALAAGNPVIAHRNRFNEWVAGDSARYFTNVEELSTIFDEFDTNSDLQAQMREGSLRRHAEEFTQEAVLNQYEQLLLQWQDQKAPRRVVEHAPAQQQLL